VSVEIQSSQKINPPSPKIYLHIGLLKGKKMDFIIQKATELGVHAIMPFTSEFTEARPPKEQKKERWHKISVEACKQCGRNWPMIIKEPSPLADQVKALNANTSAFLFWEDEKEGDAAALPHLGDLEELHLFIGPEGGFSPEEVSLCQPKMTTLSLGPLTLRAETAVITALSLSLFLAGRMKNQP
jgi:16S rRNA (uracil1498-N3)-methyltransferase